MAQANGRRAFLLAVGALMAFDGRAQAPAKLPRIGLLHNGWPKTAGHLTDAFLKGLAELGYSDGRTFVLEVRHAEGQLDRLPLLAQELASAKVDLIFTPSSLAANAARKTAVGVPIVFALAPDPIADGFAASLARPGGNMTGLTSQSPELAAKRVELLSETFPRISRLAVLYASQFPGVPLELQETERGAKVLGKQLLAVEARQLEDLEPAFAAITRWKAEALLVIENPMFFNNRKAVIALSDKYRLPAMYRVREYATAGGLMSYGPDYADLCRRAASHVVKILKGAKPGELPIERPDKFELVINLATAKAMGLTIPNAVLLRANDLLER